MSYVQIDLVRDQIAIMHNADDVLIQQCIDAAESYACEFMNRDAIEDDPRRRWKRKPRVTTENARCCHNWPYYCQCAVEPETVTTTDDSDPVPKAVVQGILLYAADYYEHRTAGSNSNVFKNPAAESLLHPFRLDIGV